ncbi:hypothetical protein MJO28_001236 [Puccinia striiformis f. sp. tritici]|uniref:Uncharacterized protein n=1 Tax=Puccinia striiformis f. sp. tritici TaxID=168172 RepID=A0ACC0F063_9BASI|nr:hypothetical protein MJO28_001236 [Puccinia striiformis f. sp. tritici]
MPGSLSTNDRLSARRSRLFNNRNRGARTTTARPRARPTTNTAQRPSNSSALPTVRIVAQEPHLNVESEILRRFGDEIPHYLGSMDDRCVSCGALHWKEERSRNDLNRESALYSTCCRKGLVIPPVRYDEIDYPDFLVPLLLGTDDQSAEFQRRLRSYNNALAFASCGAEVDRSVQGQAGIYTFRVSGGLYHNIGSVFPDGEERAAFAQIYVTGGNDLDEAQLRAEQSQSSLDVHLLLQIQQWITNNNTYARFFRTIGGNTRPEDNAQYVLRNYVRPDLDPRVYNAPRTNEVGMVIENDSPDDIAPRNITLQRIGGGFYHITDDFSGYLPIRYPMFFPNGEQGWIHGWPSGSDRPAATISQCEWYAAMIFDRQDRFSAILNGKTLFQELLVDLYICVERSRLNFFRFNQAQIRAELYRGVQESFRDDLDVEGRRIILPSSFSGSPRNMLQLYQDAMAIVRAFGKPSLFITMTANPRWTEIIVTLFAHLAPADRADLVTRVFRMKLTSLIKDIVKKHRLGKVAAWVYTIEFQKRGLPHAHIMIILEPGSVPRTPSAIDCLVSAEIPDLALEPDLHRIVTTSMLHGPCTESSMCWKDGACSKKFPKPFSPETTMVEDSYPNYRRRDNGRTFTKNGTVYNNGHVVPYNKFLTLKYGCHINVEIPYGIAAMKYLFKYICKGIDRSSLRMTEGDETRKFINGRYISPSEAVYRLLHFPTHERYPAIQRLSIHLPDEQMVYFTDEDGLRRQMETGSADRTTLTEFFRLNKLNAIGWGTPARSLLYHEIPRWFRWAKGKRFKGRKQNSEMIGRLFYASINEGERYFLRLLLLHVLGPTSFEDLRTVDGIIFPNFRAAADQLGLLVSDRHYFQCMSETALWMSGEGLRFLLCMLLLHSPPADPQNLMDSFIDHLSDDLLHRLETTYQMANPTTDDRDALCHYLIAEILAEHGKTMEDVGLYITHSRHPLWDAFANDTVEEVQRIRDHVSAFLTMSNQLNAGQTDIINTVIQMTDDSEPGMLYIDGPGGCGKTFLMNTIIHYLGASEIPVLTVASSGVAGLMLVNGMTAHSRFKIPLDIDSTSQCHWRTHSPMAVLMREAKVIIWDEISMQSRYAVEAVDRAFQDLLNCEEPFGGKMVIFGGDFRQTLPVVPHGTIFDQASVCMISSPLWRSVRTFKLTENLRLINTDEPDSAASNALFYQWLLSIGNGSNQPDFHANVNLAFGDVFKHPSTTAVETKVITQAYGDMDTISRSDDQDAILNYFGGRLILAPLNADVTHLNQICTDKFRGVIWTSVSVDAVINEEDGTESDEAVPAEVLNTVSLPGFPAHKLELKLGIPVILLRNMNMKRGLSNGTRMLIMRMEPKVLICKILSGSCVGQTVPIPKFNLPHKANHVYGVSFSRCQFPISVAFALTINKAQGQSLGNVTVYLPQPVFGHGQLYVALSRVTKIKGLSICMVGDKEAVPETQNVVNLDVIRRCHGIDQRAGLAD